MAIKIVTDSTSYIPKKYIEQYDISIVSLNIILNGKSRREVEVDNSTFYKEMDEANEFAKSSQPSPNEMYEVFENIVKNDDDIVGIFLSSDMSGTYSSANMVKEMVLENYAEARIEILDSRTNCMQMGFIAMEAAKAAKENKTIEDVVEVAKETINNSRFIFTPDTLDYLKKGGRIGGASALFGNLLQIRPILTVADGKTAVLGKVRTKKKTIETMINTLIEDVKGKDLGGVVVHHINCEGEGQKLADQIKEKLDIYVEIQSIGPIIGCHVGPGSIGIAYFTK